MYHKYSLVKDIILMKMKQLIVRAYGTSQNKVPVPYS